MRATVDGIEIEGTPSEIFDFIRHYRSQSVTDRAYESDTGDAVIGAEEASTIPEQFAYRVLKRIPLSKAQKGLLLYLKGQSPKWTLASEIHEEFSWDGTQLGGVLGGLGRRLTATSGYKSTYHMWEWRWDEDEGEWKYRLPDAVVAALERIE
jgi:predicted transcriptional regulator with HTH domain